MPEVTRAEWDQFITRYPNSHILQTSAWGDLKADFGWRVTRLVGRDCGTQVLFRKLPLGLSMAYIPKGPVGDDSQWENMWHEVDSLCHKNQAILIIVEPDLWLTNDQPWDQAIPPGFEAGLQSIQPPRSLVVDLNGDEQSLLARMKQKTRYNIRLAQRRGVVVHPGSDLTQFYRLIVDTGERDQFGVHSLEYYQRAYDLFHPQGKCEIFQADFEGAPVASLMVFAHGSRAWYFYGASSDQHREHMPTYLLQWEAMRWARDSGCMEYDLWGVPDESEATLEREFVERRDGLWGVYRFKRGFGGELRRASGPWQRVYKLPLYKIYRWWIKRRNGD